MEFKVIQNFEELILIENEWNNLISEIERPQVFYKFQWVLAYLKKVDFKLKNNLKIILAYKKNQLIAIFPFVLDGATLRFITNKTVDYNNIYIHKMVNKYQVIEKVIIYIYENIRFKEIILNNMPNDSELFILSDVIRNKINQSVILEDSVITPILKNNEISEHKFRKKQLKDIERRSKKIEKDKKLEISIGCNLSPELWDFIKENHKKKWKNSVFYKKEYIDFYEELNKTMLENMEISRLEIDGEIVAAHFGFKDDDKIYYYIPIYKEKYSSMGVGYILLKSLIEKYNYKSEFDFLRGNEGYKFNWTDNVRMNYNLYTSKSKIKILVIYTKNFLKKSKFLRTMLNK